MERCLSFALAAAADARLRDLCVAFVIPAPDASRLEVTVVVPRPLPTEDAHSLLDCLERASGGLRAELASALQRKRTPDLLFRIGTYEDEAP